MIIVLFSRRQLTMNKGTVRLILTKDLNMVKVCAKMAMKNLSNVQKRWEKKSVQTFQ